MSEILKANIFFFITGAAVLLVSACLCVALYYIICIARDVRVLVAKARKASDELEQDFEELRKQVRSEGVKVRTLVDVALSFASRLLTPKKSPAHKARKPKAKEPEELQ